MSATGGCAAGRLRANASWLTASLRSSAVLLYSLSYCCCEFSLSIANLCVPPQGEAARSLLASLVSLFRRRAQRAVLFGDGALSVSPSFLSSSFLRVPVRSLRESYILVRLGDRTPDS
eukprot:Gregarina_sp_Pseudo_9__5426@NODE_672_length_2392_cov_127_967276_g635_i0_p4_GENE_NODE_672_length_2392_cov_127_967276_g635_i0NODE_672_length_2392_cov_127_967276_g635_i0_p4_ORF_typecomplete_len118_score12_83_NODE_672_length_2392_cov_127_967276_g635_i018262179